MDKYTFRILLALFASMLVCVIVFAVKDYKITNLKREQAIEEAVIERQRESEIQIQKTERTEERSQFWQKFVPWGEDEAG